MGDDQVSQSHTNTEGNQVTDELNVNDLVKPGRFGVTNKQMIPAMKLAIQEQSVEKLQLLRSAYLYSFDKSVRYLKKDEKQFIEQHIQ